MKPLPFWIPKNLQDMQKLQRRRVQPLRLSRQSQVSRESSIKPEWQPSGVRSGCGELIFPQVSSDAPDGDMPLGGSVSK